jgi:hypothetical protein
MYDSIRGIAKVQSELSQKTKNNPKPFSYRGFIDFARRNQSKYVLLKNGMDLLVHAKHRSSLIQDYRDTL